MKVRVTKWGNSLGVRLPKAAAALLGASAGSELDLTVENNELRLRKVARKRTPSLEEMLGEIKRRGLRPPEMVDWGPDIGSEIIDDDYSRGLIVPGPDGAPVRAGHSSSHPEPVRRNVRSRRR